MTYKAQIYDLLTKFSEFFEVQPTSARLQAYTEELSKYDPEILKKAFDEIKRTCDRFPSLAAILRIIDPKADPKNEANELAGEIINCISRFGYTSPGEVKKTVGETGWFAIERFGGWENVCKTSMGDLSMVRAQLRDMCLMAKGVEERGHIEMEFIERQRLKNINKLEKIDFNGDLKRGEIDESKNRITERRVSTVRVNDRG